MVTESQRQAMKRYQQKHERVNIMLEPGTSQRIDALGLNSSRPAFIRFCLELMLHYFEELKNESTEKSMEQDTRTSGSATAAGSSTASPIMAGFSPVEQAQE